MKCKLLFVLLALSASAFCQHILYVHQSNDPRLLKYRDSLDNYNGMVEEWNWVIINMGYCPRKRFIFLTDSLHTHIGTDIIKTDVHGTFDASEGVRQQDTLIILRRFKMLLHTETQSVYISFFQQPYYTVVYRPTIGIKKQIKVHYVSIPIDTLSLPVPKKLEIEWYHNGSFDSGKKYIQFLGESKRTGK